MLSYKFVSLGVILDPIIRPFRHLFFNVSQIRYWGDYGKVRLDEIRLFVRFPPPGRIALKSLTNKNPISRPLAKKGRSPKKGPPSSLPPVTNCQAPFHHAPNDHSFITLHCNSTMYFPYLAFSYWQVTSFGDGSPFARGVHLCFLRFVAGRRDERSSISSIMDINWNFPTDVSHTKYSR